ncbi:MAG: hypothetical protein JXA06_04985 [Bacteroidetes bacterium]|nr:hypothetical protein [Bacteroidota bacterium]
MISEELFSEYQFLQLNKNRQSDLIAKHCIEVEKIIRTASSRVEAEQLSADACSHFQDECPSSIVRNALTHHVEELIKNYWPK